MKKTAARLSLELDPTPDILAEVGRKKGDRLLIGFAAETENLIEEARRKMQTKNCDMVVAISCRSRDIGFESDENEVTGAAHRRNHPRAARFESRHIAPDFRRDAEAASGTSRAHDYDELRQYLEFYQDLGVDKISIEQAQAWRQRRSLPRCHC